MILIIQDEKSKLRFNDCSKFIQFKSICNVKTYSNIPYTILLIDININDEGVVEEFNFLFEELLISLDIVAVISNRYNNKLNEICSDYRVPLIEYTN